MQNRAKILKMGSAFFSAPFKQDLARSRVQKKRKGVFSIFAAN